MIEVRNFKIGDIDYIYNNWAENPKWQGCYFKKDYNSIKNLIKLWQTKKHNNVYFEQFVIVCEEILVGTISLYEHSSEEVSVGVYVDEPFRKKGIATKAYNIITSIAKNKNYKYLSAGVLDKNLASVNFHKKLDFEEVDKYINSKENLQIKFIKDL